MQVGLSFPKGSRFKKKRDRKFAPLKKAFGRRFLRKGQTEFFGLPFLCFLSDQRFLHLPQKLRLLKAVKQNGGNSGPSGR